MCLWAQGIDVGEGSVVGGRRARGFSDNYGGVVGGRGIDGTSNGLDTTMEAAGGLTTVPRNI